MNNLQVSVSTMWRPSAPPRPDRAEIRRSADAALAAIDRAVGPRASTCGHCRAPIEPAALGCLECGRSFVPGGWDAQYRAAVMREGCIEHSNALGEVLSVR